MENHPRWYSSTPNVFPHCRDINVKFFTPFTGHLRKNFPARDVIFLVFGFHSWRFVSIKKAPAHEAEAVLPGLFYL